MLKIIFSIPKTKKYHLQETCQLLNKFGIYYSDVMSLTVLFLLFKLSLHTKYLSYLKRVNKLYLNKVVKE